MFVHYVDTASINSKTGKPYVNKRKYGDLKMKLKNSRSEVAQDIIEGMEMESAEESYIRTSHPARKKRSIQSIKPEDINDNNQVAG